MDAAQRWPVCQAICCWVSLEWGQAGKHAQHEDTTAPHVYSTGVYEGIRPLTRKLWASILGGGTQVLRLVPIQPCKKAASSYRADTAHTGVHAAEGTVSNLCHRVMQSANAMVCRGETTKEALM